MRRDPQKYLSDMLDRGQFLEQLLADRTLEELETDRVLRSAVERELMVLGEALCQLHRAAPEIAEQIDRWKDIIGFRQILVHGYDVLELPVIWGIVQNDLPLLVTQVRALLATLP